MKVKYDGSDHEHEFEAETGLPEPLPATERLLWQGSPDWRTLAREAFHVRKLAVYFAAILAVRAGFLLSQGESANEAMRAVLMLLPLVLGALGVALALAVLTARTTVYTITDKRVVMRIGIVLNLTFNLPLRRIANAGLLVGKGGMGDIPLTLARGEVIAFLHLWPHTRPWRVAQPEPMLRAIPQAADVARILAQAWTQQTGTVAVMNDTPATVTATAMVAPAAAPTVTAPTSQPAKRPSNFLLQRST